MKSLWEEYESGILTSDPNQRRIIIILEKFVRSISRQFTVGKLGAIALQYSSVYHPFIMLGDEELGTKNYREKTTMYKTNPKKPHKRNIKDEIDRKSNKNYAHQHIRKEDFEGDWPFYHEEVIIECRDDYWCIVTIEGYDYALNGAAQGRYKLEAVHDAGMAILGKSISPFIDMALNLNKTKMHNKANSADAKSRSPDFNVMPQNV